MEEKAARAYDQAALKYWGPSTHINFPVKIFKQHSVFFYFFNVWKGLFLTEMHLWCYFLAVGKLSKRGGRDEEHDQTRICCSLEKVDLCFCSYKYVTFTACFIFSSLLYLLNSSLQEKQWILKGGFNVQRSNKVFFSCFYVFL